MIGRRGAIASQTSFGGQLARQLQGKRRPSRMNPFGDCGRRKAVSAQILRRYFGQIEHRLSQAFLLHFGHHLQVGKVLVDVGLVFGQVVAVVRIGQVGRRAGQSVNRCRLLVHTRFFGLDNCGVFGIGANAVLASALNKLVMHGLHSYYPQRPIPDS
ncbi:hypothetical protein BpHYR1_031239 [Brachionus plicatilis]|uniref:Uncharacterized protein n=1 Tax=Brachionus plicatilis TaxID=10195 RepID=A0A3M7S050_BRAPC|nr:hypothetical protein BpHYR1_031239 [Brachionus plicatilis]